MYDIKRRPKQLLNYVVFHGKFSLWEANVRWIENTKNSFEEE